MEREKEIERMSRRIRVPVILQMEALECGAASLAMILAYYKRYIPLEELRNDCGVSRDGSKAGNIIKAARFHGMEAAGYKYTTERLRTLNRFPVIIHWNFNHFVVLTGFKKDRAIINDPASGTVSVSMEEFDRSYTGITLVMKPGKDFQPQGRPKSSMHFLGRYAGKYKTAMAAVCLCGLLIALAGLFTPALERIFMDYVVLSYAEEWMRNLTFAMLLLLGVTFLLRVLFSALLLRSKRMMGMEMNMNYMWHALRLPVDFFQQRLPGDISGRQMDNDTVANTLFDQLIPTLINIVMAVMYFVTLLILNPWMALIAFVSLAVEIVTWYILSAKNRDASRNISRDEGKYTGSAMAGVSMIETIKASGAENGYFEKITGYLAKYQNSKLRLQGSMMLTRFLPELMMDLCNAAVLLAGVIQILNGESTIGFLLAFQGFLSQFLSPVNTALESASEMETVFAQMERLDDVLNYPADVPETVGGTSADGGSESRLSGRLVFENVSFSYGKLEPAFIEDFSLIVEAGQMVAFVGGSGSGKSTLASLITGLYPIRCGRILFDGKERTDIERCLFTQSVSIVNQNAALFRGTIRENLTLWDDSVDEQTIIEACKDAGIYNDIMQRSSGLDFMLTEGGKNFSGGQRQRMEIARAFIKKPTLLILDEATSALDPPTEKKVMDSVKRRKMTCVVIAHRLSTIRNADQIIVLEYGKVVERGTHETLLEKNGVYAKLTGSEGM